MARTLNASVGRMGGKNRPEDVITVQQLLNRVPVPKGGPSTPLDVDGLCGPLTTNAIQKFQLHHFGWKGADGRVDPNGPTLEKLNEFDGPSPAPVTVESSMFCPHGGSVSGRSLRGAPVLTPSDPFLVTGCFFSVSPCVRVQWNGAPNKPLNSSSVGFCLNSKNLPQGMIFFR